MLRIALVGVISFGFAGAFGESLSAHSREAGGCPLGYSGCDREDPHVHCGHHDWETMGQYEPKFYCPGCYRAISTWCVVWKTVESKPYVYCRTYDKWVESLNYGGGTGSAAAERRNR